MRLQGSLHLKAKLIVRYYLTQAHNEQKSSQILFVTKINKIYSSWSKSTVAPETQTLTMITACKQNRSSE